MLISYFPIRVHNETSLATTGLLWCISNWSALAGGSVWMLSAGTGIP